jgi:hypothetical protein
MSGESCCGVSKGDKYKGTTKKICPLVGLVKVKIYCVDCPFCIKISLKGEVDCKKEGAK